MFSHGYLRSVHTNPVSGTNVTSLNSAPVRPGDAGTACALAASGGAVSFTMRFNLAGE